MGILELRTVDRVSVHATSTDSNAPVVSNPSEAAAVARAVLPTDREGFVVLHLDSRHRVRSIELVAVGTLNATMIHPREVFKGAILANAAAVLVAHNHPSGDLTPSAEDRAITSRLAEAGEILGIEVIDHVIVTNEGYLSFEAERLL